MSEQKLYCKVSQKKAMSVYGLGRFPVTLYKEQWRRLLDFSDGIKSFLNENDEELKTKPAKKLDEQPSDD